MSFFKVCIILIYIYFTHKFWYSTTLIALCGARISAPAQAATYVAAKPARVPHGRAAVVRRSLANGGSRDKAHVPAAGSLAPPAVSILNTAL